MTSDDLTAGAGFVLGWVLGSAWTLTVLRLSLRTIRPYPNRRADDGPQVDDARDVA